MSCQRVYRSKPRSLASPDPKWVFIWTSQLFTDCLAFPSHFIMSMVHFCRLWRQTAFLCPDFLFLYAEGFRLRSADECAFVKGCSSGLSTRSSSNWSIRLAVAR